jgi:hypothetical protein
VTQASELVGGEGAYAQVDRAFVLVNDRVRFALQGPGVAVGYDLYGGNLIDADRVRPRGEPGHDLLRETFPIVGLRVPSATRMEVVCDGTGGAPAVLRVVGEDMPSGVLPQLDSLAAPIGSTITTDYLLAPGSPVRLHGPALHRRGRRRLVALGTRVLPSPQRNGALNGSKGWIVRRRE